MKNLILIGLLFLLIWQPMPVAVSQANTAVKINNLDIKQKLDSKAERVLSLAKAADSIVNKPMYITKYRYRTKTITQVDTIYIFVNESDSQFIAQCPKDTVKIYIDRPIIVKKKNFLNRIFTKGWRRKQKNF